MRRFFRIVSHLLANFWLVGSITVTALSVANVIFWSHSVAMPLTIASCALVIAAGNLHGFTRDRNYLLLIGSVCMATVVVLEGFIVFDLVFIVGPLEELLRSLHGN
jgi:hypothetical protein